MYRRRRRGSRAACVLVPPFHFSGEIKPSSRVEVLRLLFNGNTHRYSVPSWLYAHHSCTHHHDEYHDVLPHVLVSNSSGLSHQLPYRSSHARVCMRRLSYLHAHRASSVFSHRDCMAGLHLLYIPIWSLYDVCSQRAVYSSSRFCSHASCTPSKAGSAVSGQVGHN